MQKELRPIFNEDSTELYWPLFCLHIDNLCKIPFHLKGRTPYFCKELEFSFVESPLQKSIGGSKNENFILRSNHIVLPIKWKEILHRLTIWSQKIGQHNSVESLLKMGLIFFYFENYSKSARWMISFWLLTCYHTPTLRKNAEKPTVMWFFTQIFFWKHSVCWISKFWTTCLHPNAICRRKVLGHPARSHLNKDNPY